MWVYARTFLTLHACMRESVFNKYAYVERRASLCLLGAHHNANIPLYYSTTTTTTTTNTFEAAHITTATMHVCNMQANNIRACTCVKLMHPTRERVCALVPQVLGRTHTHTRPDHKHTPDRENCGNVCSLYPMFMVYIVRWTGRRWHVCVASQCVECARRFNR